MALVLDSARGQHPRLAVETLDVGVVFGPRAAQPTSVTHSPAFGVAVLDREAMGALELGDREVRRCSRRGGSRSSRSRRRRRARRAWSGSPGRGHDLAGRVRTPTCRRGRSRRPGRPSGSRPPRTSAGRRSVATLTFGAKYFGEFCSFHTCQTTIGCGSVQPQGGSVGSGAGSGPGGGGVGGGSGMHSSGFTSQGSAVASPYGSSRQDRRLPERAAGPVALPRPRPRRRRTRPCVSWVRGG